MVELVDAEDVGSGELHAALSRKRSKKVRQKSCDVTRSTGAAEAVDLKAKRPQTGAGCPLVQSRIRPSHQPGISSMPQVVSLKQDSKIIRCAGMGRSLLAGFVLPLLLLPAAPAVAYEGVIDNGPLQDMQPALGINDTFGRWDTTVKLVYDPDNVPAAFSSSTKMLTLIREAALQWEQVSGIRFEIVGIDRNAPDDSLMSANQQDGQVRIFWAQTGGFAGLAGFSGAAWPLQGTGLFLLELGVAVVLFEAGGRIPMRWF
ncbi:MAG: hypothetical protein V4603_01550, partial [Pseudomonadota bacterium]